MNNQKLIIYDFPLLFEILDEIKDFLNFEIININKYEFTSLQRKEFENYLIIGNKKTQNLNNNFIIEETPIQLNKLIQNINVRFLKNKFNKQSEIHFGNYSLNFNSRVIFNDKIQLNLTEKEADIILFLKNSKKPVNIGELQTKVWGHQSKLETHTVENHIYRLRKKFSKKFKDENFILSSKLGYLIK